MHGQQAHLDRPGKSRSRGSFLPLTSLMGLRGSALRQDSRQVAEDLGSSVRITQHDHPKGSGQWGDNSVFFREPLRARSWSQWPAPPKQGQPLAAESLCSTEFWTEVRCEAHQGGAPAERSLKRPLGFAAVFPGGGARMAEIKDAGDRAAFCPVCSWRDPATVPGITPGCVQAPCGVRTRSLRERSVCSGPLQPLCWVQRPFHTL